MSSVWKHSQQRGTALLLLLALADSANDYGECYPGIAYLAQKCRMKERNLQVLLKDLEQSGELVIHRNQGQDTSTGKTNLYCVITPGALAKQGVQRNAPLPKTAVQSAAPLAPEGVQNPVTRGAKSGNEGVQRNAPNPRTLPVLHDDVAAALKSVGMTGKQQRDILAAQPDLTADEVVAWQPFHVSPPRWCDKPEGYIYRRLMDRDAPPLERTNGNGTMTEEEKTAKYMAEFNSKPVSHADYRSH